MRVAKLVGMFTVSLLLFSPAASMAQKEAKAKKPRVAILDFPAAAAVDHSTSTTPPNIPMAQV